MNQTVPKADSSLFPADELVDLYRDLQRYVGWTDDDAQNLVETGKIVEPYIVELVDDFYHQIQQHEPAHRVITGGDHQIERLKVTLREWLRQLFSGNYDDDFIRRRWRVGWRHVQIGLDQVYYAVALARLRMGIISKLTDHIQNDLAKLSPLLLSTNRILDLDLAIIDHAYSLEFARRQERSQRLMNIGQVAGGVAHELRNPLNVVKTSVYYLLNARSPTPEKVNEHLQRIQRQVNACDRTIAAISDFAKLEKPVTARVDLKPLLGRVLDAEAMPEHCTRELVGAESLIVEADERQLEIVFGNLVRNAYEAMIDGGKLVVELDQIEERPCVRIKDEGEGIPEDLLQRISEPLFSTKTRGIGLGLAIVKSILEKHQADLDVSSEIDKGTTFEIVFRSPD